MSGFSYKKMVTLKSKQVNHNVVSNSPVGKPFSSTRILSSVFLKLFWQIWYSCGTVASKFKFPKESICSMTEQRTSRPWMNLSMMTSFPYWKAKSRAFCIKSGEGTRDIPTVFSVVVGLTTQGYLNSFMSNSESFKMIFPGGQGISKPNMTDLVSCLFIAIVVFSLDDPINGIFKVSNNDLDKSGEFDKVKILWDFFLTCIWWFLLDKTCGAWPKQVWFQLSKFAKQLANLTIPLRIYLFLWNFSSLKLWTSLL